MIRRAAIAMFGDGAKGAQVCATILGI